MNDLLFTINVITPVFLIVFLGLFLKYKRFIDDAFVTTSSAMVFKITIPALIFINIAKANFSSAFHSDMILISVLGTIVFFIFLWYSTVFIKNPATRGSFIQNSFRSNYAILGFAIIFNLYGKEGMPAAAILLTFIMPLFNILSVIALLYFQENKKGNGLFGMMVEIFKNPLILAALVSIPFSVFQWHIPIVIDRTVDYLASLTLPLALIGIGGSMSFKGLKENLGLVFLSSAIKIILIPLVMTYAGVLLGLKGQSLGIMFVLFATPTAIVSFIMARAMNSDSILAANVILVSTLLSIFSIGAGIYILRVFALL